MVGDQTSQMTVFKGSYGPTAIKLVPEHKIGHVVKGCMGQVSRGGLCCIDLAPHHATHHQHTAVAGAGALVLSEKMCITKSNNGTSA